MTLPGASRERYSRFRPEIASLSLSIMPTPGPRIMFAGGLSGADGVRTGRDLAVRISIDAARIRCWLDEELIHDHTDDQRPWPDLVAGATAADDGDDRVVTLVNIAGAARELEIAIDGWAGDLSARATLLTDAGPDAGEAFAPAPSSPTAATTRGRDRLHVTLPPWSMWIARIRRTPTPSAVTPRTS